MNSGNRPHILIVGGGLGGALLANYLGRAGFRVSVYEMRPDLRTADIPAGRSINLALSVRGMHGLKEVGLLDQVMNDAVAMPGRMMHGLDGSLTFQPYGQKGQANYSVSRGGLNRILLDGTKRFENVSLHFHEKCMDVDLDAPAAEFEHARTGARTRVSADLVIGADGAFSAVRRRMQRLDRFDHSIEYLGHGYKELNIPPATGGGWRMEKNALHIWPRRRFMTIALPNADGSFTVTCFWPFEGPGGFDGLKTPDDVQRYFSAQFPDMVPLAPTLVEDYFNNPVGSLPTVRCRPWTHGRVTLLGDAAHAIVPFYGQGMNAAFEDCTELNNCLAEFAPDWERALKTYDQRRKEHSDAIAGLAVENFYEMRDKVADRRFLLRKKGQKLLHKLLPGWYIPPYEMISFTRIPYADTVRRARRQGRDIRRAGILLAAVLALAIVLIVGIAFSS